MLLIRNYYLHKDGVLLLEKTILTILTVVTRLLKFAIWFAEVSWKLRQPDPSFKQISHTDQCPIFQGVPDQVVRLHCFEDGTFWMLIKQQCLSSASKCVCVRAVYLLIFCILFSRLQIILFINLFVVWCLNFKTFCVSNKVYGLELYLFRTCCVFIYFESEKFFNRNKGVVVRLWIFNKNLINLPNKDHST